MRGPESIVSTLINLAVIFFIFKVVVKAAKKHKQSKPESQEGETIFPRSTRPEVPKQIQQRKDIEPRKVRFDTKPRVNDNQQLKRCPHCGGEIPVMMMTCEICGHKQAGCSTALWIFIAAAAGIMIALIAGSEVGWDEVFRQIEQWVGQIK